MKFLVSKHGMATLIGFTAQVFWGAGAVLVANLYSLPRFEILFFIFSVSLYLSLTRLTINKRWHLVPKVPLKMWTIGILGISFAQVAFIYAFKFAPPEKVDLINYTWPLILIIISPILLKYPLKKLQLLGVAIAFCGVFVLLTNGQGLLGFELQYWKGYFLALMGALAWCLFVIHSKKYPKVPNEMVGLYCGVAAIISLLLHCRFEHFIMPNNTELLCMLTVGFFCQGLAYSFWDHGIKFGHYTLLIVLTYLTPILSIMLLIHFGFTQLSSSLIFATLLVSLGSFIVSPIFPKLLAYFSVMSNKPWNKGCELMENKIN